MNRMNVMEKEKASFTIPPALVQVAEDMSHRTSIPFRDCLEIVIRSQKLEVTSHKIDSED